MRETITKIKGLAVNIEVVEMAHLDKNGGFLCYVASIYVLRHGSDEKRLVRKSRLPGTAENLRDQIKIQGLRVFDALCP